MKPVSKQQFDGLLEQRLNVAARALKEQLKTTENNPEHMTEELKEQVMGFLQNAVDSFGASLDAIIHRPTAGEIGEFSLGGKKEVVKRKRRTKAEIEADKAAAEAKKAEAAALSTASVAGARTMEMRPEDGGASFDEQPEEPEVEVKPTSIAEAKKPAPAVEEEPEDDTLSDLDIDELLDAVA